MNEARPMSGPAPIPVLQDIVEIRIGRDGQQVIVPLDLAQLAERIAADLVPHLRKRRRMMSPNWLNLTRPNCAASPCPPLSRLRPPTHRRAIVPI